MPITEAAKARTWAGAETTDDTVFDAAWKAAEEWVANRCTVPTLAEGEQPRGDLVTAVYILTSRLLARRNSPNALVGLDDLGAARVPGKDADVNQLIAPYRKVIV